MDTKRIKKPEKIGTLCTFSTKICFQALDSSCVCTTRFRASFHLLEELRNIPSYQFLSESGHVISRKYVKEFDSKIPEMMMVAAGTLQALCKNETIKLAGIVRNEKK